jgi:hypothetical protein
MSKLAAVEAQSDRQQAASELSADRMVARVRLLMIIAGLTTLVAIAAVVSAIGYRAFRAGGGSATATTEGVITLPKGARVIVSSLTDDRLAVTLDIGGATEIRTYDLKTLKETGRIRFATAP